MAELSEQQIQDIIERVNLRIGTTTDGQGAKLRAEKELQAVEQAELGDGIYATIDEAVAAARRAFLRYQRTGLEGRKAVISSVRSAMLENAERLAEMAHAETGLGRVVDKIMKNRLVTTRAPGPEDLELEAVTGDRGMMVTEFAPFGVVGAITPTTNPTSTIINNTISIVSAGNAVVFNVHPSAKQVSAENIRLLNRAIHAGGGPPDLVTAIPNPTIESAKAVMNHPDVALLLVTGGPGVVREAMRTDKVVIAAGPGNPPAVVDQTADVDKAGRDIVAGASLDNNIICVDEKTTIAVETIADRLVRSMAGNGAYVLKEHELKRLERVIFKEMGPSRKPGVINPAFIGKNAGVILAEIGVRVGDDVRLVVAEVPEDPQSGVDRADDAGHARRAGTRRGTGYRTGREVGARIPPHRLDPLDQRPDHHQHGPGHELQHFRRQRAQLCRPGRRGRGVLVFLHRQPDRPRLDAAAQLLP